MTKKIILSFLTFFVIGINVHAQQLPQEPQAFVKEAGKMLTDVKRDDTKETAELLKTNYEGGAFSADQMEQIISTSNKLLVNMRAYPHLENYLRAVNNTIVNGLTAAKFTEWNNVVNEIIANGRKGDYKDFQKYMDFSINFFKNGMVYTSTTKNWEARTNTFTFKYDQQPKVIFKDVTLIGMTSGDSVAIPQQEGTYFTTQEKWHVNNGKITWVNAGFPADQVYATFDKAEIDLSKSEFTVDTATLYYNELIKNPMPGRLTNKLLINSTGSVKYPQFQTFQKEFSIPNIVPKVNFRGGFELQGSTISGYGDADNRAELTFYDNKGLLVARAKSKSFSMDKNDKLASSSAETTIYFGEDSIYHPGLNLKFRINERELSGTTGEAGIGKSSFYNSFHNIDMKVERFIWKIDQPEIAFSIITAGEQNPAFFESENLFEKQKYDAYQGIMTYNPISVIKRYSETYKTRAITAHDVAKAFNPNLSIEQIRRTLYQLMEDGFIFYDRDLEMVYVKDKIFNYVFANAKLIDYDVIKLESKANRANAVLDLNSREMKINGVFTVDLSDAQFVKIFPKEKQLTMQENRDMKFSGTVFGGRLDFYGKDYKFDYDSFRISLLKLDSMTINVPQKVEGTQTAELVPLRTSFENLTGTLFIDESTNKSGKDKNLHYPIFESKSSTYAYYDQNSVYDSVYDRNKFFFEITPFTIDSLNTFNIQSQKFPGTLHSANIFPKIKNELIVQPDHSMGFTTSTPAEGYPLYNGKGHYYEAIDLSNQGLKGKGKVQYLSADIQSDDIVFFIDSMKAMAQDFTSKKGKVGSAEFPSATAKNTKIHWEPYEDFMWVRMTDQPFEFFDKYATLNGNIKMTPKGMHGAGTMDWADATLASEDFSFGVFSVYADTSELKIKALDPSKIAFNLPNVKSSIDFGEKKGNFKSNELDIPTELPYNQYQTTMNEFDWDIEKRLIEFKPPQDKEYSLFASTKKQQKGLYFQAKSGTYDMNNYILEATGVPFIKVADVHVIPDEGNITIAAEAQMEQLKNAKLVVDSISKKYTIYDATVDIYSKEELKGNGKYDYINRAKNPQVIDFHQIGNKGKEDSLYTYAEAVILDTQAIRLDPKILFKGDVSLNSKKPNLQFEGVSKLDIQDTVNIKTDWFRINDTVNPQRVVLNAMKPLSDQRDTIYTGIHFRSDSTNLYATMMGTKIFRKDATVFNAEGVVAFDPEKKVYTVTSLPKLNGNTKFGNILTYNEVSQDVTGSGRTDLGLDLGLVNFNAAGDMFKKQADTTFYFDLVAGMDFFLTKDVMEMMVKDLTTLTFDSPDLDYLNEDFQNKMVQFIGNEKAGERFLTQLNKTGEFAIPGNYKLLLTDLKLMYDPYTGTFRSQGPIGLATVDGQRVGKKLKGFVEFGKRRMGDFFNVYLETELGDWYFITYQENLLQVLSSNVHFNDLVMDIKPDDRREKGDNDQYMTFAISNPSKKSTFVERMKYYQQNP